MKMYWGKKVSALLLSSVLVVSMTACGDNAAETEKSGSSAEQEQVVLADDKTSVSEAGTYTPGGRNVRSADYDTGGYLQYADRAKWLGTLTGTWHDMGYKIGTECGEMIAASTDYWWEAMCNERGLEETEAAMEQYTYQIEALDATQIELLEGIVEGAGDYLANAKYGNESDPYYSDAFNRVLAASIFDCWLWGDPDSYQSDAAANDSSSKYINGDVSFKNDGDGCNSVAVKGSATLDGSTLSSQVRHTQQAGLDYQASMVYQSDDCNTVWSVGNVPTSNGLLLVNDKGVSISHHFGGASTDESLNYEGGPYYGSAYGVPWPNLLFYAIKEADTAEEALDILKHGSESYREKTGRTTVLRDGTWNWMVCDQDTLSVIEVSPDRYAVRYAGEYTGEDWTDPDYIVCANHFLCTYSYDENDNRTEIPMTMFNCNETSEKRFWTLMWEMKDYKGDIDVYTLQHIFEQTYLRDKDSGEYIYAMQDENGNYVTAGQAFACPQGTLGDNGLTNGTNAAKIAILDGNQSTCYFCLGNPMDWQGEWDKFQFNGK